MIFERESGILLHITSLSGDYGIGSLGKSAFDFIDFLSEADQKYWQILPTGPTGYGDSPYQTFSAFAGNPFLIDLDLLIEKDLLISADTIPNISINSSVVNFGEIYKFKNSVLRTAYKNFKPDAEFEIFCTKESYWLEDYSLFMSLKDKFEGRSWQDWPQLLRLRDDNEIRTYRNQLKNDIIYHKFVQFVFDVQWKNLHNYALSREIQIIGDLPIFIAMDSSDAWSHPEMFLFDDQRRPLCVAGVPPDFFSETGQLWGNPLYDWESLKENKFLWWQQRINKTLELVDVIRIDHFRGFAGYWAIPAGENTAINGSWEKAEGEKLFNLICSEYSLPLIAEDLGVITEDVIALKEKFGFPGMKVLQFAFGEGNDNPFLPHNYEENCIVYTGTHDNDTIKSWFDKISCKEKRFVQNYLKLEQRNICWAMIETAWKSRANIAIAPMQDFLCLGEDARMNTPGTFGNNWVWRLLPDQLNDELALRIKDMTRKYNR